MAEIGSINRSVAILDLFIQGEYEIGPTDVAKKLKISHSTANRTMSALCSADILIKADKRGKYRLSAKFLDLARAYLSNVKLEDVALRYMTKLKNITKETIGLYRRENSERVCIARIDSDESIRVVLSPGKRSPIYAGAPSKILLAYLPDDKIEEILKSINMVKITELTKTTIAEIMQDLLEVRKNGYAFTKGEQIEHAFAVSAPIRDHKGNITAAIAITAPKIFLTAENQREYTMLVKEVAAEISHEMGFLESDQKIS